MHSSIIVKYRIKRGGNVVEGDNNEILKELRGHPKEFCRQHEFILLKK